MLARISSPILFGRDPELELLSDALAAAAAGRPGVIVIGGEAGIGKTRLVSEFAARAVAGGASAYTGNCIDIGGGQGLPFAPIAAIVRALARAESPASLDAILGPAKADLAPLVSDLGEPSSATEMNDPASVDRYGQARLLERALGLIERLGRRAPTLLVVEDIQWIDGASRLLLTFLASNLRTERVLIVATFRTDHLDRDHPVFDWLVELDRRPVVRTLSLGSLNPADVRAQLAAILGHEPEQDFSSQVVARADGNPLFAEELLARGRRGGDLPETLGQLLLRRVADLSTPARRLVQAGAVIGRPFDERLLAAVLDVGEAEIAEPLHEATAHLILEAGHGRYEFRHALLREAVEGRLTAGERRALHARIGTVLAERAGLGAPSPAVAAGEVADHWLAADAPVEALRATVLAALAATSAQAFGDAADRYARALELQSRLTPAAVDLALESIGLDQATLRARASRVARYAEAPSDRGSAAARLGLSPREWEVLALIAAGRTNGEIARSLFITPKTASSHVSHILDKLGAANRVEAAMIAARAGHLPGPGPSSGVDQGPSGSQP